MSTDLKQILVCGSTAPTASRKAFAQAAHRLLTTECPSIPRLEAIAHDHGTLAELVHKNSCGYCQKSITLFREMSDLKPWPDALFEVALQAVHNLRELAARTFDLVAGSPQTVFAGGQKEPGTRAEFYCVDTLIVRPDLSWQPARAELRKLDFIQHRDLWMILRLQEPVKEFRDDDRFELLVMSDVQAFGPFTLPSLPAGDEEEIMLQVPHSLAQEWEEQMKASATLPFQFIFSVRE
jgi:hypothetical protein